MDLVAILIVVLGLGAVVVLGLGIFFALAAGAMNSYTKSRTTSPDRTVTILDDLFNGEERVTYRAGRQPVQAATLIEGAIARGYRMETELKDQGRTIYVFARADVAASPTMTDTA